MTPKAGTPAESVHSPWWMVNQQSRQLMSNLTYSGVVYVPPGFMEIRVGIPDDAPSARYAKFVVFGTRKMAPRNFIGKAAFTNMDTLSGILLAGKAV